MEQKVFNIAVIVSGIDEEYQNSILLGIHEFAKTRNINICHFIAFGGMLGNQKHDIGEFNIYNLVNYEKLDGVILLNNTIYFTEMKFKIITELENHSIPVVSIDQDLPSHYYVGINNYKAMYELVEHVISAHGAKKLNFITGPDNNPESNLRFQAFQDVLEEHSIPFEEERVYHGLFLSKDGRSAVERFLASDLPFPDAIICANDVMAISATIALEKHNIIAPQDVIITGFDNIYNARNYAPSITSVARPLFQSGYRACEIIFQHCNGQKQPRVQIFDTSLALAESCGCKNITSDNANSFRKDNLSVLDRYQVDVQRNNSMACSLTESESLEDNIAKLKVCVNAIACEEFYLCMCDDWDSTSATKGEDKDFHFENYIINGYTDKIHVVLAYRDGDFFDCPDFQAKEMLPRLFEPQEKGKSYFFLPIHFRERCLGYCVICNCRFPMESPNFPSWIMNISNSLENVRKMICMDAVVQELDKLYIIDPLSGIYNRNGFTRGTQENYQYCTERSLPVMVMFMDMDGLKYINDTYGHKAGDKAIRALGQVLKQACVNGEIYSRFGGDEFLIFAVDYTDAQAKALTQKIEELLHHYNETEKDVFTLNASIGYHIETPTANTPLFSLITIADLKMYEEKKKKKQSRYLRR